MNNPDLIALGNQDYSGAFTTDGGKTWKYTNFYEGWGGYSYGAYVVDERTIIFVCRDFSGKYGSGEGVDVIIRSTDGGETWESTGVVLDGSLNILGVVGEENVLLVGGWRSEDKGETWTKSDEKEGFDAVLTYASDGSAVIMNSFANAPPSEFCSAFWVTEQKPLQTRETITNTSHLRFAGRSLSFSSAFAERISGSETIKHASPAAFVGFTGSPSTSIP